MHEGIEVLSFLFLWIKYNRSEIITWSFGTLTVVVTDWKSRAIAFAAIRHDSHLEVTSLRPIHLLSRHLPHSNPSKVLLPLLIDSDSSTNPLLLHLPLHRRSPLRCKVSCTRSIPRGRLSWGSWFSFWVPINQVCIGIGLSWLPLFRLLIAFISVLKRMYLFYLSHLVIVSTGHLGHLLL